MGIYFMSQKKPVLESFLHFPVPQALLSITFHVGFLCRIICPLHWLSQRQTVTTGSSAKAEIYATDAFVKFLIELEQLFDFLQIKDSFMPTTNIVYNDNKACVDWSKSSTAKELRRIQMKENRVRENIAKHFVQIHHVSGKVNLADLFTKEIKDTGHFVELHDLMMCHCFVS
jgi:hypothetical protein